jgi:hypothetical protein
MRQCHLQVLFVACLAVLVAATPVLNQIDDLAKPTIKPGDSSDAANFALHQHGDFSQQMATLPPTAVVAPSDADVLLPGIPATGPLDLMEGAATRPEGLPILLPSPGRTVLPSGSEAVARLAQTGHLEAVATAHGKTASELAELLYLDKDLKLTNRSQLVYVCTGLFPVTPQHGAVDEVAAQDHTHHHNHHRHYRKLAQVNADEADPPPSSLTLSATGVPLLHSRSSAAKKIYLDFDGHTTTGQLA